MGLTIKREMLNRWCGASVQSHRSFWTESCKCFIFWRCHVKINRRVPWKPQKQLQWVSVGFLLRFHVFSLGSLALGWPHWHIRRIYSCQWTINYVYSTFIRDIILRKRSELFFVFAVNGNKLQPRCVKKDFFSLANLSVSNRVDRF